MAVQLEHETLDLTLSSEDFNLAFFEFDIAWVTVAIDDLLLAFGDSHRSTG